jgi:hypothetical protein
VAASSIAVELSLKVKLEMPLPLFDLLDIMPNPSKKWAFASSTTLPWLPSTCELPIQKRSNASWF